MKRFLTVVAAMVMVAGLSDAAVITTFSGPAGQTAWQNAVGGWTTFQFTGNFNSTPAGTTINPVVSGNNNYSGIVGNEFRDVLVNGDFAPGLVASTTTVTWNGGPMSAVGGLWDTSTNNEGGGINIILNLVNGLGTQLVTHLGPTNGFFGWTSDTAFTSFTLTTNQTLTNQFGVPYGVEHYEVDNLQVSTVPEPATLSMVGLALLGLGAFRRYRRS